MVEMAKNLLRILLCALVAFGVASAAFGADNSDESIVHATVGVGAVNASAEPNDDPITAQGAFFVAHLDAAQSGDIAEIAQSASFSLGCDDCVLPALITPEMGLEDGERLLSAPADYAYCTHFSSGTGAAQTIVELNAGAADVLTVRGETSGDAVVYFVRLDLLQTARALSYCDYVSFEAEAQPDLQTAVADAVDIRAEGAGDGYADPSKAIAF